MKKIQKFKYLIISIVLLQIVIISVGAFFKISHYPYANEFLVIGLSLNIITFLVTLTDMILAKIENKALWIIGLFLSSGIVSILYFITRKNT